MDDPRIGSIKPPPPEGPAPRPSLPEGVADFPLPYVGQTVHFFPHRGHHPEWYFGPHAAIIIRLHPNDSRIAHLYFLGPKGEVGSYESIPHRSLRPECYPVESWLGHAMPPSTHWTFVDGT